MISAMPFPLFDKNFNTVEADLVHSAQGGDLEAFNAIVLQYQNLLFRIAERTLSDSESAEDAVQEAFISAFQHIDSFRGGSLKGWLIRIVINKCHDQSRISRRCKYVSLDDSLLNYESDFLPYSQIADDSPSVEEYLEVREEGAALRGYLNDLPFHFRTIMVLADLEEFNYREIAKYLGVPVGTVKSRLARARLKFHSILIERGACFSGRLEETIERGK